MKQKTPETSKSSPSEQKNKQTVNINILASKF